MVWRVAPTASASSCCDNPRAMRAAGLPLQRNWLSIIAVIWAGQAVSMVTSYAAGYAVVWYVTESTGSALVLSVMTIAVMFPVGLVSPFGGIVADKHNRKVIMIAADGAIGVVSLVAGFLVLAGDVSLPLLLAVCIARAVGQAFHSPAMMATMPMLVPDKHLLRINTLDQLLTSVASIGAPAFGIFLYTTLGFSSVMFLDFAGACAAILGLALAKVPTVVDPSAEKQHVLANLRDGWHAVSKTRGLVLLWVTEPLHAVMGLASPVGIAIGGVLAEAMGIAPFFLVDGLACLVLGLVAHLPPSIRTLDR